MFGHAKTSAKPGEPRRAWSAPADHERILARARSIWGRRPPAWDTVSWANARAAAPVSGCRVRCAAWMSARAAGSANTWSTAWTRSLAAERYWDQARWAVE